MLEYTGGTINCEKNYVSTLYHTPEVPANYPQNSGHVRQRKVQAQ